MHIWTTMHLRLSDFCTSVWAVFRFTTSHNKYPTFRIRECMHIVFVDAPIDLKFDTGASTCSCCWDKPFRSWYSTDKSSLLQHPVYSLCAACALLVEFERLLLALSSCKITIYLLYDVASELRSSFPSVPKSPCFAIKDGHVWTALIIGLIV